MTTRTPRRKNRSVLIAAALTAAATAACVLAAGTVKDLTSEGPQPWSAMPGTTAAFVAVDADPSLSQKVEAVKLADIFGGGKGADPAQIATTALLGDIPSSAVLPWAGPRAAAGVATATGSSLTSSAFRVVAVEDDTRMRAALTALRAKRTPQQFGFAPVGTGWVLLAGDQRTADDLAAAATRTPLTKDGAVQRDLTAAPKARVATGWVDLAKLDQAVTGSLESSPLRRLGSIPGVGTAHVSGRAVLGAYLRSGALQVDLHATGWTVADRPAMPTAATSADLLAGMPADAAAAVGLAQPAAYAEGWFASLSQGERDRWTTQANTMGIRLPEDFRTALGTEASAALLTGKGTSGVVVKTRTDDPFNGFHAVQSFTQQYLFPNTGILWDAALEGSDIITGTSPTVVQAAKTGTGLGQSKAFKAAVPARGPATFVGYANLPAVLAATGAAADTAVPGTAKFTDALKDKADQLNALGLWLGKANAAGDVDASARLTLR